MAVERVTPTRVYRFYRGGALIDRLRGEPGQDTELPEDWIGSIVEARNPGQEDGLSRLADGRLLRDAIAADPAYWGEPRVLVKLLDSSERLPVHAHPGRPFAREHLGSPYGKTEAWVVVATRGDDADVWLGLRDGVERDAYRRWIDAQDTDALLDSLNRLTVRAGDVVYVPAGVPHAIGAGVLILEVQEPTDFSILCEWRGFPVEPEKAHLGLGWDRALEALELDAFTPSHGLPPEAEEFFHVDETPEPAGRFAVLVVLEGEGEIDGNRARAGDAFVVPARAEPFGVSGAMRVVRCS
jgi:mannose-6-phosphate isomerase